MSILYHYTDAGGLLGILEQAQLWCTHFAFLNDPGEPDFARRMYGESLHDLSEDASVDEGTRLVAAELHERFTRNESALTLGPSSLRKRPLNFVACLSAAADDLGQWRGYSSPGARYAIGFDEAVLSELADAQDMRLAKVDYGRQGARDLSRSAILKWVTPLPDQLKTEPKRIDPMALVGDMIFLVARCGPWMKHEGYESEKEWRIARKLPNAAIDKEVHFRTGRSYIVPYVKLCLSAGIGKNLIKEIWIGPAPHPEVSDAGVWHLLRRSPFSKRGAEPVLRMSTIPYRDW